MTVKLHLVIIVFFNHSYNIITIYVCVAHAVETVSPNFIKFIAVA